MFKNPKLNKEDYEYMNSLSSAILQKRPKKLHIVLIFWLVTVLAFIIWAKLASIDEIARGNGEVVPSGENQIVQNLEGGIIEEILVAEGEIVKKGQILLKINNKRSESTFETNYLQSYALDAKIVRLKAQADGTKFKYKGKLNLKVKPLIENEESLYESNLKQFEAKINTFKNQLLQRKNEIINARSQKNSSTNSLLMISEEINIITPMVQKGLSSKLDLLTLKREKNNISQQHKSAKLAILRFEAEIEEIKNRISEAKHLFQSKSKEELSEAIVKLQGLIAKKGALEDQVLRTLVRAPMNGIVQKLFVHTVSGVVKPAENLVEIVPIENKLIIEIRIKPSDIAFIYLQQKAKVKFSAFDFSIYGALEGKVVHISADTIKDEENNRFYIVRIKTNKNSFIRAEKELKIIPGMTVDVDILTGKKTVFDYILKPILKTKQYTFSER